MTSFFFVRILTGRECRKKQESISSTLLFESEVSILLGLKNHERTDLQLSEDYTASFDYRKSILI